jgi:hypothetical protein
MNRMRMMLAAMVSMAMFPGWVEGQEGSQSARFPVAVVSVAELPAGAGAFEVIRRPDHSPQDVILIRENVSGEILSQAVWTLVLAHQAQPVPVQEERVRIRDSSSAGGDLRPWPWADRVVEDLRDAQVVKIQGLGFVKALIIWLPRQSPAPPDEFRDGESH